MDGTCRDATAWLCPHSSPTAVCSALPALSILGGRSGHPAGTWGHSSARKQCCARVLWGWAVGVSTRRVLGRLVSSLGASRSTSVSHCNIISGEKRSSLSIASKQQPLPPVLCLCSMVGSGWPCVLVPAFYPQGGCIFCRRGGQSMTCSKKSCRDGHPLMGTVGPSPGASTEPSHSPLLVHGETSGQYANKIQYFFFLTVSSDYYYYFFSKFHTQRYKPTKITLSHLFLGPHCLCFLCDHKEDAAQTLSLFL